MYKDIFEAIRANDESAVRNFLAQEVDLNIIDPETHFTPTALAVELDFDDLAELLIGYEEIARRPTTTDVQSIDLSRLTKFSRSDQIPLSFSQQRLWFLEELMPGKALYQVPVVLKLTGSCDVEALRRAYTAMIVRHESLRTRFESREGNPVQIIDQANHLSTLIVTQSAILSSDVKTHLEVQIMRPFDLVHGPLIRGELILLNENESILFINMHHIITDGVSSQIYLKELSEFYSHFTQGSPAPKALSVQYVDYTLWQRSWLQGDVLKRQVDYWKVHLNDIPEVISLPTDHARPKELTHAGSSIRFALPTNLVSTLKSFTQQHQVTMYMTLLAAFQLVLHRYSGQKVVVVGSPIANRRDEQMESMIGFFVNTLVLKADFNAPLTVKQLLEQIKATTLSAYEYQDVPFEQLVTQLNIPRQTNVNPLFQVMFAYQEESKSEKTMGNLHLSEVEESEYPIAKFDLTLNAMYVDEKLHCSAEYSTDLFEHATIARFIDHFTRLLNVMVQQPESLIERLPMLSDAEIQQQLVTWNQTERAYPQTTVHQLFEAQVERTPNAVALVYENQEMTYAELNARANQVAHYLRSQGVGPDSLVGLGLERSFEMMIGILAILKAGGAYVPLDPHYPEDRRRFVLQDTQVIILLTHSSLDRKWETVLSERVSIIRLDQESLFQDQSTFNLAVNTTRTNLAYVIYTSGSTGQPKGVMIEHHSLINHMLWIQQHYGINPEDVVIQKTSISFDASVWEIFSLLLGCKIHLASLNIKENIFLLVEEVHQSHATVLQLVPSVLEAIMPYITLEKCRTLRSLFLGGEALKSGLINKLLDILPDISIVNLYGPTESTIDASSFICTERVKTNTVPIGKPVNNIQFYVLDHAHALVPVGVSGELYIGGDGLARGYLNRPELTQERFIEHRFSEQSDPVRLYKTGDLVRYLPDGNIEYVGRTDNQIKIRGFRVELEEIEAQLLKQSYIVNAAVIVKGDASNRQLVAYLISNEIFDEETHTKTAFIQALKAHLATFLPDYMIPAQILLIDEMPLNVNGKVDRKALAALELNFVSSGEYQAPTTETEKQLAESWSQVLKISVEKIGLHDDFFALGGDSILSMQLTSKLRTAGFECNVKLIFDHRTIHALAFALNSHKATIKIDAEQGVLTGRFDLLPIQALFIESKGENYDYYNQSFLISVPSLDVKRLSRALVALVQHHDALRLRYEAGSQVYQNTLEVPEINVLHCVGLEDEFIQATLTEWQRHFNLEKGPLWQVGYLDGLPDGQARIYVALHHFIVDAVSWRILAHDLQLLYAGKSLSKKTSSYRQWVQTVSFYPSLHVEERRYWQDLVSDQKDLFDLTQDVVAYNIQFEREVTRHLLQSSAKAYHTEINDLLLTALGYALKVCSGQSTAHIVLEGHGREKISENIDVTHTMGWFTTIFPVKLTVEEDLGASIQANKENLRKIPNKGLGYSAFRYVDKDAVLNSHPLPQVSFNYLGQFGSEAQADWQVTGEPSGMSAAVDSVRICHAIDINGFVADDMLQFSVVCHLDPDLGRQFVEAFETSLKAVVTHCVEQVQSGQEHYTPSDFPEVNITPELLKQLQKKYDIEALYPANSLQQGFVFHALSQPDDDAYSVQALFDMHEVIEVAHYKQAWEKVVETYPALRVCFNWDEGIIQIINKSASFGFFEHDITEAADKDGAINEIQREDRARGFTLDQPGLLRVHLIKQATNHYTMLTSEHHAITDGWSSAIVMNKVLEYYTQLTQGKKVVVHEQRSYLHAQAYLAQHKQSDSRYWKEKLAAVDETNDLSAFLMRTVDLDKVKVIADPQKEHVRLEGEAYQTLTLLAKQHGLTLNVLIQYAWHKLIQVYTRSLVTIVGTTIAGRDLPVEGIEQSVGIYINTLPLVMNWHETDTVLDQLKHLHGLTTELNAHSNVSLADLQRSGKRLFHSLFIYENYPADQTSKDRLVFRNAIEKVDYPFSIMAFDADQALHIQLEYAGEYLQKTQAQRMLNQLSLILQGIPNKLNALHYEIDLVSQQEKQKQLMEWNQTERAYPPTTVHQLFELQVERAPNAVALVYENQEMTYAELNARANQVAHYCHVSL